MNIDQLERSPQHNRKTAVTPAASRQPIAALIDAIRVPVIMPIVILAVLLLLPFWLPPPRTSTAIDIGAEVGLNEYGESRQGFYLFDVNGPERDGTGQTYRWTKPFSTLRLLDIFALGSPLMLELRMCSCRPANTPVAQTTLKINTLRPLELPLNSQLRTYRMLVPQRASDYGRDLYLELRSTTFRLPGDDRDLGARLDNARVSFLHPWELLGMPPLIAWLFYAAAIVGAWMLTTVGSRQLADARHETRDARQEGTALKTQNSKLKTQNSKLIVVPTLVAAFLLITPYLYGPHTFTLPMISVMSVLAIYGALLVARTAIHRFVLAGAGLWIVWSSQVLGHWMLDDAYISFHYAANMLAGHGLVFNPGERVEGYTNFLWTMLSAIPIAWGGDPTLPMSLLTLALGVGTMLLTYRWGLVPDARQETRDRGRKIGHRPPTTDRRPPIITLFAPLMLAVSSPFLLYTARGSGMETALFTFLLAAGSFAAQRSRTARGGCVAGALLALATMTRPDGLLGVAAAGLCLLIRHTKDEKLALSLSEGRKAKDGHLVSHIPHPASITFSLAFLMIFVPYYLWRYTYYGYPLPNTFYAKVGTGWAQAQRGFDYTNAFAATIGWRFVAALLLGGLAAWSWRAWRDNQKTSENEPTRLNLILWLSSSIFRLSSFTLHLLLIVALYISYTIAVGGDHFPGFRFFVPILPLLALLLQSALMSLARIRLGRWSLNPVIRPLPAFGTGALAFIYLTFTAMQLPATDIGVAWSDIRGENNVVEKNRELGLWLRDTTLPTTVVATGIAGALPFYSDLRVIDTLGLNDLHIAHLDVRGMGAGEAGAEKTDVPYVLEQRPDYIPYSTSGTFQGYPRFKQEYTLIEVRGPEGRAIKLYRRIVK